MTTALPDTKVLMIGAGGLACAIAPVLARSGLGRIDFCDPDRIELSNLHRQLLYQERDVGMPKAPLAASRLIQEAEPANFTLKSVAREMRVLPENAVATVAEYDLVIEGSDNHATKFLAADACRIAGVPVIQAGVIRWYGWAFANAPGRSACLRCLFEDLPESTPTCTAAGVVGPVVGVVGALAAALVLRMLSGDDAAAGELWRYEGLSGALRSTRIARRDGCALCAGFIRDTDVSRYMPPERAA